VGTGGPFPGAKRGRGVTLTVTDIGWPCHMQAVSDFNAIYIFVQFEVVDKSYVSLFIYLFNPLETDW
jgi:hypothetical protein